MKHARGLSGRERAPLPVLACAAAAIAASLAPLVAFIADGVAGADWTGRIGLGRVSAALLRLQDPAVGAAVRFSLLQALASTAAAVAIGLPGAWIVGRYRFRGRRFFLALAAVPFCLPPVLVILAFVLFYGNSGWLAGAMRFAGFPVREGGGILYGFWGLVLVHAFYNFPIVLQVVGSLWSRLPRTREEAARTLGAGRFRAFAAGTLPALLPSMAQAASLVFLFCFFSFTVVLVFGGLAGSTLEVGIYRAVRFSGDKSTALALGIVQTLVSLTVVSFFALLDGRNRSIQADLGRVVPAGAPRGAARAAVAIYSGIILVFFVGPLLALFAQAFTVKVGPSGTAHIGVGNFVRLVSGFQAPLWRALAATAVTAVPAALLAAVAGVSVAVFLGYGPSRNGTVRGAGMASRLTETIFSLPLAISPVIVTVGLTVLVPSGARTVVILAQAAAIWPYIAKSVAGALAALDGRRNQAARTLGAGPLKAVLTADLPLVAPSLAAAVAFGFSMAAGDANAPLLLGGGAVETLPLLVYRLISAYRFQEACAVGLVLACLTGLVFFIKERTPDGS